MTKYKKQNFSNTFKNARKGMRLSIKSERNIRVHLFTASLVLVTAYCLNFSIVKFCILLLTIAGVISAEMFNSAIEFSLDAIFHNRYWNRIWRKRSYNCNACQKQSNGSFKNRFISKFNNKSFNKGDKSL